MLQMRLGLLESFLDLDNSCLVPQFKEGKITIMDMSCPFVGANTACILFRIGLQLYLQSKAAGKMVVLDEAHKVCNIVLMMATFSADYFHSTCFLILARKPSMNRF